MWLLVYHVSHLHASLKAAVPLSSLPPLQVATKIYSLTALGVFLLNANQKLFLSFCWSTFSNSFISKTKNSNRGP